MGMACTACGVPCSSPNLKFLSQWPAARPSSLRLLPWRLWQERLARGASGVGITGLSGFGILSPVNHPCLGVVLVQIHAMQSLCTSWIDWWDETQDLPLESAQPEPELHPLLGVRPPRRGPQLCLRMSPWFVRRATISIPHVAVHQH